MALLGKFTKQSTETIDYDVDYSDWFSTRADSPAAYAVEAEAGITVAGHTRIGNVVKIVLSGGTDGGRYKVTVRMTSNSTPPVVKEADFLVAVKDV